MSDPLPRAARPFLTFVTLLRVNGFAIAPEQTTAFLSAISLLGPRDPEDIRRAGLATLAPPPERHGAYDTLFRLHFLGEDAPAPVDVITTGELAAQGNPSMLELTKRLPASAGVLGDASQFDTRSQFTEGAAGDVACGDEQPPGIAGEGDERVDHSAHGSVGVQIPDDDVSSAGACRGD